MKVPFVISKRNCGVIFIYREKSNTRIQHVYFCKQFFLHSVFCAMQLSAVLVTSAFWRHSWCLLLALLQAFIDECAAVFQVLLHIARCLVFALVNVATLLQAFGGFIRCCECHAQLKQWHTILVLYEYGGVTALTGVKLRMHNHVLTLNFQILRSLAWDALIFISALCALCTVLAAMTYT